MFRLPPQNDFRELLDTARDYRRDGWNAHDATLLAADALYPFREFRGPQVAYDYNNARDVRYLVPTQWTPELDR